MTVASDRSQPPPLGVYGHEGMLIYGTWLSRAAGAGLTANIALAQPMSLKSAAGKYS